MVQILPSLSIIGCGNIGSSLATGLLGVYKGYESKITLTRRNTKPIRHFQDYGIVVSSDNKKAIANSELIILAVKPMQMEAIVEEINAYAVSKKQIIISMVTAYSLDKLQQDIRLAFPLFRVVPNTSIDIGTSITAYSGRNYSKSQEEKLLTVFNNVGETILLDEELIDAATILGACGIAYVMRFMRAMMQGGIQIGFDAESAEKIVTQTVIGAASLLKSRKTHPEQEIDRVSTPQGCTIFGLNQMEHHGFSSALIKGISASFQKIDELKKK